MGEKASGIYWIGGLLGLTAGLDAMAKRKVMPLPGIEPPVVQPVT
jgi:hypothetical protein